MTLKSALAVISLAFGLSACGGGGGSSPAPSKFTLSGTISAASGTLVDIDVNDPSRQSKQQLGNAFLTNNATDEAQLLPNPVLLNGFVCRNPACATSYDDSNFAYSTDIYDYYRVTLAAGQFVSLQVTDYLAEQPSLNNIDLELIDATGVLSPIISNSLSEYESVAAPQDGEYFIQVKAAAGMSKYILSIGSSSLVSGPRAYGTPMNFVSGEVIVKLKPLSVISATAAAAPNTPALALSHSDRTRPGLLRFAVPDSPTRSSTAGASNASSLASTLEQRYQAQFYQDQRATLDMIAELNQRNDVEYAEPNYFVHAKATPNDPLYRYQTHYPQISLPQAWDLSTGTPDQGSVVVAVVDTGVALSHEDLAGQLVAGYDFIRDPGTSMDGNGIDPNPDDPGHDVDDLLSVWHGTHVAGTIAARTDNNQGVAGVSWGAKIMPIRALNAAGSGTTYDVEQGIRFAAGLANDSHTVPAKTADIINLSLGGGGYSQAAQNLFTQIRNTTSAIVVAAAGNERSTSPAYPASYNHVLSVSAVDSANGLARYTNTGSFIDIAAPGGDQSRDLNRDGYGDGVLSTTMKPVSSTSAYSSAYYFLEGTSMATPHVAGVAALMKAVYPDLSAAQFDASLECGQLTVDLGASGRDNLFGYGLIDALKAIQAAQTLSTMPEDEPHSCALPIATPGRVDFGAVTSVVSKPLVLTSNGTSPPAINAYAIAHGSTWLTIDDSAVNSEGYGTYVLNIDRSGLTDAIYSDNIVFSFSDGQTLSVPVTMQVQNQVAADGDAGYLFVLLIDANSYEVIDMIGTDVSDGQYSFSFTEVPAGEYVIIAGSDVDNDYYLCGPGEACGAYPSNEQPLSLSVNDNKNALDFLVTIVSNVVSGTQIEASNHQGFSRPKLGRQVQSDALNR